MIEAYHAAFGPWLGRLAGLWQLILIFITEALVVRELEEFIATTILPNTPSYVIAGLILFPACYGAYHGLEVVGRMAEIISPIGIAITLGLFLLSIPYMEPDQIRPVLADGWSPSCGAGAWPSGGPVSFCGTAGKTNFTLCRM